MRSKLLSPIVFAAALSACAVEPEALNSERIEQRFGSYGVDVLQYSAGIRRSSLYSVAGDERICRTYAVVRFRDENIAGVTSEHAEVLAGQSIGATFKASGWHIQKTTLYVGALELQADQHPIARLMHLRQGTELAMHAYQLVLEQGDQSIDYATIVEVHHPDYLSPAELGRLYGDPAATRLDEQQMRELRALVLDLD